MNESSTAGTGSLASEVFPTAKREVGSRIVEGRRFLSISSTTDSEAATRRGLLLVQLYGVYEYAVRSSVRGALDHVRSESMGCSDLQGSLLSLVLDPQWMSAGTAGPERRWEARIKLIDEMASDQPLVTLNDTIFPSDGSHYRVRQLHTIWRVFGIQVPVVPDQRLRGRIAELVENRNAVAHGRRTARAVGGQLSQHEMDDRVTDTKMIANYVIDTMSDHCSAGALKA